MTEISLRSLVWLTYRLGATFAFGVPLILFFWASREKELSILRLLSIYWKSSSLMVINILLLAGNRPIGHLTSLICPIFLIISVWFWVDLNQEIGDFPRWKPIALTVKIWRWALSCFGILYATLSILSLSCLTLSTERNCYAWKEAPNNFQDIAKNIFNFLFGASWSPTLAAFIGYLALIAYFVGLLQWVLIKIPKQGRIAGGF